MEYKVLVTDERSMKIVLCKYENRKLVDKEIKLFYAVNYRYI